MSESRRRARVDHGTVYREVQGETVLLQLESGDYFGLDAVGTRIWQLIIEKSDLAEVEAALRKEFDAEEDVVSRDFATLVDELASRRLIHIELAEIDND